MWHSVCWGNSSPSTSICTCQELPAWVLMGCCSIWCYAWFQEQGGGCIKQLRQRDVLVQRHKTVTPFTFPEYDVKLHQACMYRWAEKGFKCFSKTHPTHQGAAVPRPLHSTSYPAVSPIPKAFSRLCSRSVLPPLARAWGRWAHRRGFSWPLCLFLTALPACRANTHSSHSASLWGA